LHNFSSSDDSKGKLSLLLIRDDFYDTDYISREIFLDLLDTLSPGDAELVTFEEGQGHLLRQRSQKKLATLPLHLSLRTPPMMGSERRTRRRSGLKRNAWGAAQVMMG